MLDQLTDRCATMCLVVVLCSLYPNWMFLLQISLVIDISAHWLHMHSTLLGGAESHKAIDLSANPILYHYYTNRKILFFMCAGNELFYASLYLLYFTSGPIFLGLSLLKALAVICAPIAFAKSAISLVHLYAASLNIVAIDTAERQSKGL